MSLRHLLRLMSQFLGCPRHHRCAIHRIRPMPSACSESLDRCGSLKGFRKIKGVLMKYPIGSMYGIFTYIWLILMVHVGKYTIHGSYGYILLTWI